MSEKIFNAILFKLECLRQEANVLRNGFEAFETTRAMAIYDLKTIKSDLLAARTELQQISLFDSLVNNSSTLWQKSTDSMLFGFFKSLY
jgi:hypothetical protein